MSALDDGFRPDAHERLRRLLLLVPYVSEHPGLGVDEVAKVLGISREDLLSDLDLLTLVGRPPFQPDDFVDIYVEDEKVYVHLDQRLSAPPRLTAAEGAALAAAATLLKPAASERLARALGKLEKVLPEGARERYQQMGRALDVALEAPFGLQPLSQAVAQGLEVEFDYLAQSRESSGRRRVRPYELISHRGQWYLSGHCLARDGVRLFRLDRMASLEVTSTTFTERPAEKARLSDTETGETTARVRFSKCAAPYVRERFTEGITLEAEGSVVVDIVGETDRWLAHWVLSFGGDAEVLSPKSAREAVARLAQASLESALGR